MFTLNPDADTNETCLLMTLECPPVCLVELFGKPAEADGHKVSGEYVFISDCGDVFTVYEWKNTTLCWGEGSGCLTPKEFWDSEESVDLCVGGRKGSDPRPFVKWLVGRIEQHDANLQELFDRLDKSLEKAKAKRA